MRQITERVSIPCAGPARKLPAILQQSESLLTLASLLTSAELGDWTLRRTRAKKHKYMHVEVQEDVRQLNKLHILQILQHEFMHLNGAYKSK